VKGKEEKGKEKREFREESALLLLSVGGASKEIDKVLDSKSRGAGRRSLGACLR